MSSDKYPQPFQDLINMLGTLPGIGRRSAERIAFSMLKWPQDKLASLGTTISELRLKLTFCPECKNLSSEGRPCDICSSASRDRSAICVVEEPSQVRNIENSGLYKGLYHVLGGRLSPLEGKGHADLNIDSLVSRVDSGAVKEVIIALSSDVEGQATSIYIAELLNGRNVQITRLAQGLPAGSDISYADSATIAAAMRGRRPV